MAEIYITIKVHDILKDRISKSRNLDDGKMRVAIPKGSAIRDLLILLDLSDDWVGLITVNMRQSGPEKQLADGDVVELFSPLVGG